MNSFIELLKKDAGAEHEFADEKLVSSLYCTSLSHPLREEPNSPDFKTENQWLFRENDDSGSIKVINFDRIPEMCSCSGVSRKKSDHNENKRKPAKINFKKSVDEVTDRIGKEINKIGFSVCNEDDFPVPGIPDFVKIKGKGSIRNYTLFTDTDFREVVEKEFFGNWDWGDYSEFFST